MHPFPHHYHASATAKAAGEVKLSGPGLPALASDGPAEFGGPGNLWSPETLLTAALADCFVLSLRAVAAASKFEWLAVSCEVTGKLDRIDKVSQFTEFSIRARLTIPAGADAERARRLLEKSEQICLISNSLKAERHLQIEIEQA
ncbi:MAG: OsmC family protein [Steroidobacteraceae bacterium]